MFYCLASVTVIVYTDADHAAKDKVPPRILLSTHPHMHAYTKSPTTQRRRQWSLHS